MTRALQCCGLLVGLLSPCGWAGTVYVNGTTGDDAWDGRCPIWVGGTCGPKATIQSGMEAAAVGDSVIVADGTYRGAGNRDLDSHGKPITVRSANGPGNCVIDCQGSNANQHHGFYLGAYQAGCVVQGFTIRNGYADAGAAVYCDQDSSHTIINCTFSGNTAQQDGGAVYCAWRSSPVIVDCNITGNTAGHLGGGVYCAQDSRPVAMNCVISGNTAAAAGWGGYAGGGVYCGWYSSPRIYGCTVTRNTVGWYGWGGGIGAQPGSSPDIDGCTITDNDAGRGGGLCSADATVTNSTIAENRGTEYGGGIYCAGGSATIDGCVIRDNEAPQGGGICSDGTTHLWISDCLVAWNTAHEYGGGIFCSYGYQTVLGCRITDNAARIGGGIYAAGEDAAITNCVIAWNTATEDAAAVFCGYGPVAMVNCTLTRNAAAAPYGEGLVCGPSNVTITNSILWADTPRELAASGGNLTVTYSDVQGGCSGTGNIDTDPLIVDPYGDDYHLSPVSPGINAGSNHEPLLPGVDIGGDLRIQLCRVDMGAYESPYAPMVLDDCNHNGIEDDCDIFNGASADANSDGIPDECEAPPACRGDTNCDGNVTWRDIDYFVAAQSDNVSAWWARFAAPGPSCPFTNNDTNGDGHTTWRDVSPFVGLMNTACP